MGLFIILLRLYLGAAIFLAAFLVVRHRHRHPRHVNYQMQRFPFSTWTDEPERVRWWRR